MKEEKLSEDIAVLLLKNLEQEDYKHVLDEAYDLAYRIDMGWFKLPGSPYYTERLAKVRSAAGRV